MKPPEPVLVLDLFAPTREALLELLESFSAAEWEKPTVCKGWSVKDVALHLLAGEIGILSRRRDAFTPRGPAPKNYAELVELINWLNDTWVQAARRMSPRILCDLLEWAGPQVEKFFASLDPMALGEPVNWASDQPAPNWLDLAREYTERWHHQQQIRDAADRPGLKEPRFFAPVLAAFVQALPRAFRGVEAPAGTLVRLTIAGNSGAQWLVARKGAGWKLFVAGDEKPAAEVTLDQEDAWRLFTKGLSKEAARSRATMRGDQALARRVLDTVATLG